MSRTTRKNFWRYRRFDGSETQDDWRKRLHLQLIRGHRPAKENAELKTSGGWYGYWFGWPDIPGRNCAKAKKWAKQLSSKTRRRIDKLVIRQELDQYEKD